MTHHRTIFPALLLVALAGCGSDSSPVDRDQHDTAKGLLSPISTAAEFEVSLKAALTQPATAAQLAAADAAAEAQGSFTGTYTQEANVDELDAVRYDGEHLFVAPRRYFHCCFIFTDAASTQPAAPPERSIRILATDPATAGADLVGEIALDDGVSVQGMYVDDDKLIALTGTLVYGSFGDMWADIAIWAPEDSGFRIYDVADPANPVLDVDVVMDGVFVESRRIGDTVYVISRYTPRVEGLHYYVTDAQQRTENEATLASLTLDDLLPKVSINGISRPLIEPERCYITTDDVVPYPVITSVTAIPIDNPEGFRTTCYNEDTYGVYVSQDALYLVEDRYDTAGAKSVSRVHKFALAGIDVSYRGSADVTGYVWQGGQADFRMSEHNGDLRLFASEWSGANDDFVDHKLYVLREANDRPDLDIIAALPNANRPAEIGKPNEDLYGVRFLGDVAYAVTFERIDPLYAIDLSNPSDPFIAGELEVTGFSDFLHPVNDDLLLGLGRSSEGSIKLELFDVSDISRPLSRGSALIGGAGSYSEAQYDRHAFTYLANASGTDRFTIPAHVYDPDDSWSYLHSALYLFEIRDKDMPSLTTLVEVGSILRPAAGPERWAERSRSYPHGDTVYYVSDEDVWSAFWDTPSVVNGPF